MNIVTYNVELVPAYLFDGPMFCIYRPSNRSGSVKMHILQHPDTQFNFNSCLSELLCAGIPGQVSPSTGGGARGTEGFNYSSEGYNKSRDGYKDLRGYKE